MELVFPFGDNSVVSRIRPFCGGIRCVLFCNLVPSCPVALLAQVRAAQHLLSEKGSILDIPREMSACMADGKYLELVKLYRKAHTTYSSSILSQVRYMHVFC